MLAARVLQKIARVRSGWAKLPRVGFWPDPSLISGQKSFIINLFNEWVVCLALVRRQMNLALFISFNWFSIKFHICPYLEIILICYTNFLSFYSRVSQMIIEVNMWIFQYLFIIFFGVFFCAFLTSDASLGWSVPQVAQLVIPLLKFFRTLRNTYILV